MTPVDFKLLTYAELGAALGITAASAKRLAIRRGWQKTPGNDGKARVSVPVERLQAGGDDTGDDTPPVPGDDPNDATGDGGDTQEPHLPVALEVLTRHIERLEGELVEVRSALDAERVRAAQVDALNAVLEIERKRAEELRQERDRWAGAAEVAQRQISDMTKRPEPMEANGVRGAIRRWLGVN